MQLCTNSGCYESLGSHYTLSHKLYGLQRQLTPFQKRVLQEIGSVLATILLEMVKMKSGEEFELKEQMPLPS